MGQKGCCEVKAITKQRSDRAELFLEDQLYEKILETVSQSKDTTSSNGQRIGLYGEDVCLRAELV
jgi:hypothetical protein